MKKIILIDSKRCLGCKSCEIQCAIAHSESKNLQQAIHEIPAPASRVSVESTAEYVVPLQCRHCEDAPCVKVCPTKALKKPEADGPVLIDDALCIGCKWCVVVCPFGVINMNREGKVVIKCDLCSERLAKGEEPACVAGCPTGALQFVSLKELQGKKRKEFLVRFKDGDGT